MSSLKTDMIARCSSRPIAASYNRATLYHAVVKQDKQSILEILQHDVDWRLRDDNGETVLHLAFDRKDNTSRQIIEVLEIFLDLGMDVNAKNNIGKTSMHLAVRDKSKEVVEFLLSRGSDLNIRDERGNSIAHYLVETEFKIFRKCVSAYGTPDDRNLLERESVEFIYWLMGKGLDVECPNNTGITALQLVMRRNLQHILPIFLKFAREVNFVDGDNRTILHIFLELNGYYKNFSRQNDTQKVAIPSFFYGTEYGINIMQILLDKGFSVDAVDCEGNTPLHIAGKTEESDMLRMMLEKFTNVNVSNVLGETLMHIVVTECMDYVGFYYDGYVEVVRSLISKGADIHLKNGNGHTVVQLAAMNKHWEILNALKEHNADFRVLTSEGQNLLHLIGRNNREMVSDTTYDKMVDLLITEGCDVNAKDGNGNYPLHVAAHFGSSAVVRKLLEHGAVVDCREKFFQSTPLHRTLESEYEHLNVISELVAAGADINAKNVSGVTPLHLAVRHCSGVTVNLLLRLGAHVDAYDKFGRLPLDRAVANNNPAGVDELLRYGADINDINTRKAIVHLNDSYMYHVLMDHWYKLKAAGLHCVDDYMSYNEDDLKCSRINFAIEVEELKIFMIDKRTSLYDFLHMNPNKKCFYVKASVELEELMNSLSLELKFPKYYGVIMASYREGLARRQLLEPAKQAWFELTRIYLPNICLEQILDNLSNVYLRHLVEGDNVKILKRRTSRKNCKSAKKIRIE